MPNSINLSSSISCFIRDLHKYFKILFKPISENIKNIFLFFGK
nr:MAG TPA: hypothetical protein [Caudoviricetes sp.]